MTRFADQRELEVWYARADMDELTVLVKDQFGKEKRKRFAQAQAKARTHDHLQAFKKMTTVTNGRRRIVADPPLIVPADDLLPDADRADLEQWIRQVLAGYADTLPMDRRRLFSAFDFVDLARKVVGVGSVGTRCWLVLLSGPLYRNQGERVVCGQRLMQAASDIFLGWQTVEPSMGRRATSTSGSCGTGRDRRSSKPWIRRRCGCTPPSAAGHWPGRTPGPAIGSPSPDTSMAAPRSIRRWSSSPNATRTSTTTITHA
jgi:hypothetical protein